MAVVSSFKMNGIKITTDLLVMTFPYGHGHCRRRLQYPAIGSD